MRRPSCSISAAGLDEIAELERLVRRSARALWVGDYAAEQIEAALQTTIGLDTQLVRDQTYLVSRLAGRIVACGGWSFRRTLFGSDTAAGRQPELLDPATDAARIRAFLVEPEFSRRGFGTLLLDACEAAAVARGFSRSELMATLSGQHLYEACGYVASESVQHAIGPRLHIRFVPMSKALNRNVRHDT